ncbi:MAG: class I tRNA ligase family protein [Lentisphaeria bacterium]|nr:class I tRNA ligase family protein [Lentisphaeria bacterium]
MSLSFSRVAERVDGWGIPVPGHPDQIIYVWIDALINYVSGQGIGEGSGDLEFWDSSTDKIHVIGKNVWKFHAVYWPAFLLSAGLPLPEKLLVHGFLTVNGEKISKSGANAVDPFPLIAEYGADALRYYLLRSFSPFGDGDFNVDGLAATYNSDLANGLGNLVSRLLTLGEKSDLHTPIYDRHYQPPPAFARALETFEFDSALKALWEQINGINREIDQEKPWLALKAGDPEAIHPSLRRWLGTLAEIAHWLCPFLPDASAEIQKRLSQPEIRAGTPIFPRLAGNASKRDSRRAPLTGLICST